MHLGVPCPLRFSYTHAQRTLKPESQFAAFQDLVYVNCRLQARLSEHLELTEKLAGTEKP